MNTTEGAPLRALASRLADAIPEWVAAIGADAVVQNAEALQACETATFATSQRVFSILRPADAVEVSQCVAIANRHVIPVYPVSRGRNWGLGSRVPASDAVVIDLSRLSHIRSCDETFGSIRLGPGATFQDVHVFLKNSGSAWFLPTIGGPQDASVVANFLERGDGAGPHADRLANIVSLQVVLASGERIETGYARFGIATSLEHLSSEPAGPALNGLFTQSNLGIVTKATLLLALKPKNLQLCAIQIPESRLIALIEDLRPLALELEGCAEISLWNGHKIKARERVATFEAGNWFCTIALYAPSALMAQAQRELLLERLKDFSAQMEVFDEETLPQFEEHSAIFVGVPSDRNIASLYAGKPSVPTGPLDPERDRCGAIWLCPELPLRGETISRAIQLCEQTLNHFGYPPVLGMTILHGRTARLFVSIFYDRDNPGEDARALACHNSLQVQLRTAGFLPFRLGIASVNSFPGDETPTTRFITALKDSVDPYGILSPGRPFRSSRIFS